MDAVSPISKGLIREPNENKSIWTLDKSFHKIHLISNNPQDETKNILKMNTRGTSSKEYTTSQKNTLKGLHLLSHRPKQAQVCSHLWWNQIHLYLGESICRSMPRDRWWARAAWLMVEERRKAEGRKLLVETQWFIIVHWEQRSVRKQRVLAGIGSLEQMKQFYSDEPQPETIVHLCHHVRCLSAQWREGCSRQREGRLAAIAKRHWSLGL